MDLTEPLLNGVTGKLEAFYGDGAYNKKKARRAVTRTGAKVIVPPAKNAVKSKGDVAELIERDQAIDRIEQIGRKEWKQEVGYHQRSLSETARRPKRDSSKPSDFFVNVLCGIDIFLNRSTV